MLLDPLIAYVTVSAENVPRLAGALDGNHIHPLSISQPDFTQLLQ